MPSQKLSTDTNNINPILHSYSTAIDFYSDRDVAGTTVDARERIKEEQNLGIGVDDQLTFTNLSS